MSYYKEPSCSHTRRNATSDNKPSHVKRLNFGQSVLDLDIVEPSGCTLNRSLVINQDIARIPCTEKGDYVRKWIETHRDDMCDTSSGSFQLSPVLGRTPTETPSERSPILGNSKKLTRKKTRIDRHNKAIAKSTDHVDFHESAEHSADIFIRSTTTYGGEEENENEQNHAHSSQHTPRCIKRTIIDVSPVIGTRHHLSSHQERQGQLYHGLRNYNFQKRLKRDDDKDKTTHVNLSIKTDNKLETVRENLSMEVDVNSSSSETTENPGKWHKYTDTFRLLTEARLNFENNSSDSIDSKSNSKIEIDSSDNSNNKSLNKSPSTPNSNNGDSNIIEEVDTQEHASTIADIPQLSIPISSSSTSKAPSKSLQLIDRNETFCSEPEIIQNPSTHLSAEISQVPSLKQGAVSSQTDCIISSITTPTKTSQNEITYAYLLDSGKKRRKPKKGSMVAELRSLINMQISEIRIWRHRMNKEHDATSKQFITVLVRSCSKQFGNQFLKGIVIDDRFNLLQNEEKEIEESTLHGSQIQSKRSLQKDITIMLVCNIVGTLKMKSEIVINVYPPWDVLDKNDLTLDAMYINIVHNYEIPESLRRGGVEKEEKLKKQIVKEFNCPCIEEERELPFCARKPNSDKPDVMQQIFDS